jgi:hypothetical protein
MSNNGNGSNMRQLFGNANNAANAPAAAAAAANVAVNAANVAVNAANAAAGTTARVNVNGKKFNAVITPVGGKRRRNKTNCGKRRRNKTNGGKRKSVRRKRKGTRRNKRN